MTKLNERESQRLEQETDLKARILLEVGMQMPHRFSRNGRVFPAGQAFQSQVLVRDLLKLGLFAMNIPSMADLPDRLGERPVTFATVPEAFLGLALRYAVIVSESSRDPEPIVEIDDLDRRVRRLEAHFGRIDIDMSLVARVAQCARDVSLSPELANGGQ